MIGLHTQHIVDQHTRVCEAVMSDFLKIRGLWDGADGSKAKAARRHGHRFALQHIGRWAPMVQSVIFDGAYICTVVTSVEFSTDGIAAITSVQG